MPFTFWQEVAFFAICTLIWVAVLFVSCAIFVAWTTFFKF